MKNRRKELLVQLVRAVGVRIDNVLGMLQSGVQMAPFASLTVAERIDGHDVDKYTFEYWQACGSILTEKPHTYVLSSGQIASRFDWAHACPSEHPWKRPFMGLPQDLGT